METLVFNSYVGGACIFEYYKGRTEMLRANQGYAALFQENYSYDHVDTDRDILRILDPGNRDTFVQTIETAIVTKAPAECEMCLVSSDGAVFMHIRVTMRQIAFTEDRSLIYAVVNDITSQREAERIEREATHRIATIMSNIDAGVVAVVVKDGLATYHFANNRYYELLGYDKASYEAQFTGTFSTIHPGGSGESEQRHYAGLA